MNLSNCSPIACARSFLCAHGLEGRHVVVALSGGADSVVLLHTLCALQEELGLKVSAIHVNHMIRGAEADRDEAFCKALCQSLGVPFGSYKKDVPAYAEENGVSLETGARLVRYEVFDACIDQNEEALLATAHNATDNAETVLFRLARGTGLAGLCGIPPVRGRYIRPLLSLTSEEIRSYAAEAGLDFVEDTTNSDLALTRNYIRHELMPRLDKVHSGAVTHISSMVEVLSRDEEYLTALSRRLIEETSADQLRYALAKAPDPIATRALRALYEAARVSPDALTFELTEAALALVRKEEKLLQMTLPQGVVMRLWGGEIRFLGAEQEHYPPQALTMGLNLLAGRGGAMMLSNVPITEASCPEMKFYKQLTHTSFLSAIIADGLYVREKQDGDAYRYGGMTRKLKKLFCDSKLSPDEKRKIPVLCDGKGILWVPGYGVRDADVEVDANRIYLCYMTEEVHD